MIFLEKLSHLYENEKNILTNQYKTNFLSIMIYLFVCFIVLSGLHFVKLDEITTKEYSIVIGITISCILTILFVLNTFFPIIIFNKICKINVWLSMFFSLALILSYLSISYKIFGNNMTFLLTGFQLMTVVHPLILMGLFFKFEFKNDFDSNLKIALNNKKYDLFNDYFVSKNEPIFKEKNNQILLLDLLLEKNENNTLNDEIKNELTLVDNFNKAKLKYIIEPNSIFVEFVKDIITNNQFIDEINQMKNTLNNEMKQFNHQLNHVIQKEIKKQKDLIQNSQFILNESHQWCSDDKLSELETKDTNLMKQLNNINIQLNQDVIDKWKAEIEQIKQEKEKYVEEVKQKILDLELFIRNSLIKEFNKNK